MGYDTSLSVVSPSVCLSVRHAKLSDFLEIKTKMFIDDPSINSLHARGCKVKGQGSEHAEIVLRLYCSVCGPINFTYFSPGCDCACCVTRTANVLAVIIILSIIMCNIIIIILSMSAGLSTPVSR